MRFRTLSLDAFGPFTAFSLDFSAANQGGLHLIYGPNEAGKSSALRAIRDLLFGIPERTPDAHRHGTAQLRLGAVIERNGEELAFVRRKKRKDSLFTANEEPLEEAKLARFLNGLDESGFERLFGLDHQRLREGGEEMLRGEGDVGEALFDAGAAGRSVHGVRLALDAEAEALFKPQAQKPELNRSLSLYSEQKRAVAETRGSSDKYRAQVEHLQEQARATEGVRAELSALRREKEHLLRLRGVLFSVAERDAKAAARLEAGEPPRLAKTTRAQRLELENTIAEAERDGLRLERELRDLDARLARLEPERSFRPLDAELLRALREGVGRIGKSEVDLPKRRAEAKAIAEAIQAELPRLGLGADLGAALARSMSIAEQAQVRALGAQHGLLRARVESKAEELMSARNRVTVLELRVQLERGRRRLERAALAEPELVERLERGLETARAERARLDATEQERRLERVRLAEQRRALSQLGELPSDALLQTARSERDSVLQRIYLRLVGSPPDVESTAAELVASALARGARADELADRLRREARRVAEALGLDEKIARVEAELGALALRKREAEAVLAERREAWTRVAVSLGGPELVPSEARRILEGERSAWREIERDEQALAAATAELSLATESEGAARRALADWRAAFGAAVSPLGLDEHALPEVASALLAGLEELERKRQRFVDMERRVDSIGRDIEEFRALVANATRRFDPELARLGPTEAAERLLEGHQRALALVKERTLLDEQQREKQAELARLRADLAHAAAQLAELCRAAGVRTSADLAAAEERALRIAALELELASIDARLTEASGGEPVEALVAEARRMERGAVQARLLELDDLVGVREDDLRSRDKELLSLEAGLERYQGRDGADAAQELAESAARVADLSAAWARRKLASFVLERVVENYREQHQDPVLRRASELFERLTLGRFSRLRVGLEESQLECVSAETGEGLALGALSEGTGYQLFLALRLASLEQYLRIAPPLPLVLDDVLIHFDDERASVALSVLAELSERVQVLLFTHHARDLDAAERARARGDARIFTHQLRASGSS